jgi:hypothetical protein
MNIALQESGSKLKRAVTGCALPGQTFIWLPFAGGISAFAVILPKLVGTDHGDESRTVVFFTEYTQPNAL